MQLSAGAGSGACFCGVGKGKDFFFGKIGGYAAGKVVGEQVEPGETEQQAEKGKI